jgi:hypothetical protein
MKRRHAAALALLGWYLMLPPIIPDGRGGYTVAVDAPLSKQFVNGSYDRASDCDDLRSSVVAKGGRDRERLHRHTLEWALAVQSTQAQCISTDDPRLNNR